MYLTPIERLTRDLKEVHQNCRFESVVRIGFHLINHSYTDEHSVHGIAVSLLRMVLIRGNVAALGDWISRTVRSGELNQWMDEDFWYLTNRASQLKSLIQSEASYGHVVRCGCRQYSGVQVATGRKSSPAAGFAVEPNFLGDLVAEVRTISSQRNDSLKLQTAIGYLGQSRRCRTNIASILAEIEFASALQPKTTLALLGVNDLNFGFNPADRMIDAALILGFRANEIEDYAIASGIASVQRGGLKDRIQSSDVVLAARGEADWPEFKLSDFNVEKQGVLDLGDLESEIASTRSAVRTRASIFHEFLY